MIKIPAPLEFVDTAVFGCDLAKQITRLYEFDEELGKELALAAIIYVMTGGVEISDNPIVNTVLQGSEKFVTKNVAKWEEKKTNKEEEEIRKKKLEEISSLMRQGYKQIEISRELGLPPSTVSDRVRTIRKKYSYLLDNSSENLVVTNPDFRTKVITNSDE